MRQHLCAQHELAALRSGEVIIRTLPAIPTAGLSGDDIPQLIAQCHAQMQACIANMDTQLGESLPAQTDAEQR